MIKSGSRCALSNNHFRAPVVQFRYDIANPESIAMRLSFVIAFAFVFLSAPASSLSAQTPPAAPPPAAAPDTSQRKVATAVRRNGEVTLDGRLDEAAWQSAKPIGGFVQSYPKANELAPDQTEVRVLYDDAALYVGVRMFDKNPRKSPRSSRDVTRAGFTPTGRT
jgi:hypothetical protein